MRVNNDVKSVLNFAKEYTVSDLTNKKSKQTDKIEITNTSKAFDKLNDFLNMGKPGKMDISDLTPEEREQFLKMISNLLKKGIVGYEIREVDGKPEKHFIVNQIGNKRLYGTKLYTKKDIYYNR